MLIKSSSRIMFFFFQAEDGIRDLTVTGVQTCALPIYPHELRKMEDVPDLENVQKLDATKLNKNELKLATTLVQEMATTLSDIDTADNYYEALRTLIDSKIKGKKVVEYEVEEVPRLDIMSALKKSLQASNRKPMVKAAAEKKKPQIELVKPRTAKKRKVG